MTEIRIIGSGSSGNGLILKSSYQTLILELGCRFYDYIDQLSSDELFSIAGCVFTHSHGDHINPSTAKEFLRRGFDIYCHEEVIEDLKEKGFLPFFKPIKSNYANKIGDFTIQTFKAPHNVPNYGFLITTPINERILFLTDTTGVSLRFKNINAILVECNHDEDTLLDNIDRHDVSMAHPEYHLGLKDCCEFCKQNISVSTKQVVLIHLSSTNINEKHAVETVKEYCNFQNVAVAHKGDVFKIENDDF